MSLLLSYCLILLLLYNCLPYPEQHLKVCPDNCTCGAADTGENACYAADIDHTNPRIQADIIEWMRWLRTDLGFDAFRFDNTKGYAGGFTNYYIQQTDPVYTVSVLRPIIAP